MKGLFIKDIMNLKGQAKVYLFIAVAWGVVAIANKSAAFLCGLLTMFTLLVPVSAAAYDEKAKWDKYALTFPISRKQLVFSKYLLGLAFGVAGEIIGFIFALILRVPVFEAIWICLGCLSVGAVMLAVAMPLIFRFGAEKGRLVLIVVVVAPTLIGLLWPSLGFAAMSSEFTNNLFYAAPFIALAALLVSVLISCAILKGKEY